MQRGRLTSRGRTTIPAAMRERLGLNPGPLLFEERDGGVFIRADPAVGRISGLLDGKLKGPLLPIREEKQAAACEWARAEVSRDVD